METVDQLTEAVMDIAREESHADAEIIIADRIRKHITPYITALVQARETIRTWNGMKLSGAAEATAWDIYSRNAPEMRAINEALANAVGR